ncbi:MAG: shikimate kinase [Phyllobacteriaceae bacterium]|nr:shikimate kinase [Phyllobacteriaceae bacterium]
MDTTELAWVANSARIIRSLIGKRPVVLVGLMGSGKSTIGRKLAQILDVDFFDSDAEIESAARMSVKDLFSVYGEPEFRALEQRVMLRLMDDGPRIISTGGGAFINPEIRAAVQARGIAVWLDADLDVLMERVGRRETRPLLQNDDPEGTMRALMDTRYPVYAQAPIRVISRNERKDVMAGEVVEALRVWLERDAETAEAALKAHP